MQLSEPGKPLQSFGKLGVNLKFPNVHIFSDIDVVNGPLWRVSSTGKLFDALTAGFDASLNTHLEDKDQSPELTDFNLAASYLAPTWQITTRTFDSVSAARVSYLQFLSPNVVVGSQLDYRFKANSQKLTLGGRIRFDGL